MSQATLLPCHRMARCCTETTAAELFLLTFDRRPFDVSDLRRRPAEDTHGATCHERFGLVYAGQVEVLQVWSLSCRWAFTVWISQSPQWRTGDRNALESGHCLIDGYQSINECFRHSAWSTTFRAMRVVTWESLFENRFLRVASWELDPLVFFNLSGWCSPKKSVQHLLCWSMRWNQFEWVNWDGESLLTLEKCKWKKKIVSDGCVKCVEILVTNANSKLLLLLIVVLI